jgi:hypothetical protein
LIHIITRGAGNGGLVTEVSIPAIPVILWAQDDGLTEKHRYTPLAKRPSQEWINDTPTAHNGAPSVKVLQAPIPHKDWCEYTQNGATAQSIQHCIDSRQPEPPIEPEIEFPQKMRKRKYPLSLSRLIYSLQFNVR